MTVSDLRRIPTFGYESSKIRAKTIEDGKAKRSYERLPDFAKGIIAAGAIGKDETIKRGSKKIYEGHNIGKCIGYMPGISVFQGISKMVNAVRFRNKKQYEAKTLFFRGLVETVGLGIVFLPVDKKVTHDRKKTAAKLAALYTGE